MKEIDSLRACSEPSAVRIMISSVRGVGGRPRDVAIVWGIREFDAPVSMMQVIGEQGRGFPWSSRTFNRREGRPSGEVKAVS